MSDIEFEQETVEVEQWEEPGDGVKKPKWPLVIGIISIAWGSIGLLCGGLITVWRAVMPGMVEQALEGDPLPDAMVMDASDWIIAVGSLGLALLILFAGIACVTRRPITRVMHLLYAILTIPLVVWSYMISTADQEQLKQWVEQYPNNQISQQVQRQNASVNELIGLVLTIVLGFAIPLFYLIWFGLIKTKPEQITGGEEGVY